MKKTNITLSIALAAVFSASTAFAEAEVTGKIVHESAAFTESGIGIGAATTSIQTANSHGKDVMKTETSARIYIDGDAEAMQEGATYHVELNLMRDSKGVDKYDGNESYTQRDALREAYVDAEVNDFSIRAGKQQVVWGTADGMKLLDAINPTDYAEMAQNQMEDSRIPVWMINAETEDTNGGNWQFIVSEPKSHNIAGLGIASGSATSHTNGNSGNAFIMKGVDTITGKVNGFMNMAPALGKAANFFASFPGSDATAQTGSGALRNYGRTRVTDYVNDYLAGNQDRTVYTTDVMVYGYDNEGDFGATCNVAGVGTTASFCEAADLAHIANSTKTDYQHTGYLTDVAAAGNQDVTNIIDRTNAEWDITNPTSLFEYMDQAAFGTFSAFVNMETEYRVEDQKGANTALRYKNTMPSGLNYSLNYMNGEDANPYVSVHWEDADTGTKLYENEVNDCRVVGTTNANTICGTTSGTHDITQITLWTGEAGTGTKHTYEGSSDTTTDGAAKMVFTEKHADIHQFGGSFDTAIETAQFGPVVIRGEGLYQKDVMTPVINRAKLRIGSGTGAFTNEKADFFKYVIGADITALTNMMISAQLIQIRNLDYVNETVNANSGNSTATGGRYTADTTAMHMSNGLQKAEENKEFYSLFLSKPFGASGEHRWNNIFMFEENGGKWNRLDAEFSIDDDTQVTAEFNNYAGDPDTQFGQLANSSNVQIGFKYSF